MKSTLQDVHNQITSAVAADLTARHTQFDAEELEAVIAPGLRINHNETFLTAPSRGNRRSNLPGYLPLPYSPASPLTARNR